MTKTTHLQPTDLVGLARLTVDATQGITGLVEAMHHTIGSAPSPLGKTPAGTTRGLTRLVYRGIRGVTRLVGGSLDTVLGLLTPRLTKKPSSREREAILAALNGVLGDYLEATSNPLAIPMSFRQEGQKLDLSQPASLAAAFPEPAGKLLIFIHGLCMNDLQWQAPVLAVPNVPDVPAVPAVPAVPFPTFPASFTQLHLHYNSGRPISQNGRELADLLERLLAAWPVPITELDLLTHSMGGLLARSAHFYATAAGHGWPRHLKRLFFLGTPHHGAPLERGGNLFESLLLESPYSAPFSRLGKIRSAGITDLRYGNLRESDAAGPDRFERREDGRQPLPLPPGVAAFAIAATTTATPGKLATRFLGDGLVPVDSALGRHPRPEFCLDLPPENTRVFPGIGHLQLLSDPEVRQQILSWLES